MKQCEIEQKNTGCRDLNSIEDIMNGLKSLFQSGENISENNLQSIDSSLTKLTQVIRQGKFSETPTQSPIDYPCIVNEIPPENPEQLRNRLRASGYSESLLDVTFNALKVDPEIRAKYEKAYDFAVGKSDKNGAFICGEYGTGKTWLAAAIGHKAAENGAWVLFGTFAKITSDLMSAMKSGGSEYAVLWERYTKKADLVIVDDIGKEKPTDWKLQQLFELVDTRLSNGKKTVFTSNYSLGALKSRITPENSDDCTAGALLDRMKNFEPIILNGESRR